MQHQNPQEEKCGKLYSIINRYFINRHCRENKKDKCGTVKQEYSQATTVKTKVLTYKEVTFYNKKMVKFKVGKGLKINWSKDDKEMSCEHVGGRSAPCVARELQITTMIHSAHLLNSQK
jgi:hypothetical protein